MSQLKSSDRLEDQRPSDPIQRRKPPLRKIMHSNRGVSAVEFALVLPLLLVILFGIIEFGLVLYNQAVITNASREGARYAAGFYTNPANATKERAACSDIQSFIVNYVHKHFITLTASTFNADNVKCCSNTTCSTTTNPYYYDSDAPLAGYIDTVRIEYQYQFFVVGSLISLINGSLSPTLNLNAQTVMRDENQNL